MITNEFIDRVGFVTVLIGMERDRDEAIRITESVNAQFLTIDENDSVSESLIIYFSSGFIPETILFDRDGNIVESIVGGNADVFREAIINALPAVE
ncbi:MAG: hypothetical protein FWE83_06580 [Oscillospiraceae bacterium]|nr:hypothetical protein [Oscillospiraceae bacterium]